MLKKQLETQARNREERIMEAKGGQPWKRERQKIVSKEAARSRRTRDVIFASEI